jgi:hypothetical protein
VCLTAAAVAAPVAGCDTASEQKPTVLGPRPAPQTTPAYPVSPRATTGNTVSALAAARAYAVAARAWTPETYLRQWRRQVSGSAGSLRRALRGSKPTGPEIARLRADRARVDVTVVSVTPAGTATPAGGVPRASVVVALDETTTVGSASARRRTISRIELARHGRNWLVVGFEPAA